MSEKEKLSEERKLIFAAKQGNSEAFAELYQKHVRKIYA